MNKFFTLILLCTLSITYGQTVADLEAFDIDTTGYLNGSDLSGGFYDGNIFLKNEYYADYGSWVGWAITNHVDTTTPGFFNQYSAIVGSGNEGSTNYATSYSFGSNEILQEGDAAGKTMEGMYVTNSTYTYLSMRDGDAYAKKFGGASGDDPDYFLLTIKGYVDGGLTADSINFYLADYRFDNNAMDYLVDEWTYIDLTSLGDIHGLQLALSSSDTGQFGMNTPAYFCVDDIETTDMSTSNVNIENNSPKIYPNPVSDVVYVTDYENRVNYEVRDLKGHKIKGGQLQQGENIELSELQTGQYFLSLWNEEFSEVELFFKD